MKRPTSSINAILATIALLLTLIFLVMAQADTAASSQKTDDQGIVLGTGNLNKAGDIQGGGTSYSPQQAGQISPNQLGNLNL